MDEIKDSIKKEGIVTLDSEVKSFANSLPYWARYLAKKLLVGLTIEEDDFKTALNYFKEDNELKKKEERSEIKIEIAHNEELDFKADLFLKEIKNLEGVNALVENQSIEISPNITIIYGANGSGKTGYIRILNNAFYSRSNDKDIIPNINFDVGHKTPACKFIFQSEGKTYTLDYPDDRGKTELQQFAVFDRKSLLVHLNDKKEFFFRPRALDFFTDLISAYESLKEKLDMEIASKNILKDFSVLFDGDSEIKKQLDELSTQTKIFELKKHTPFSEQDKENRIKLEDQKIELEATKKSKDQQIKNLEIIKRLIDKLRTDIETNNSSFTTIKIKEIQKAISDFINKQKTAREEGIENFKTDKLKDIGSPEWKAFIDAAETYAKKQEKDKYPGKDDYCLFCQQLLNEKEIQLIESYWTFIKSKSEEDARKAKTVLEQLNKKYRNINFDLLPENNLLTEWLKENRSDTFKSLLIALQTQKELCENIIRDIDSQGFSKRLQYKIDHSELTKIDISLAEKIKELKEKNVDEELKKINISIIYLNHKEKLTTHINEIEKYINNLRWVDKAENRKSEFNSASVTIAGKRLSNKYFGQAYSDKFIEECNALNAHFDIKLIHSGSYGSSYREFKIKDRLPSQILSEGEQRAISLADFLAEIQLSGINRGIIIDDPVNSLDEERKSIIAKRLVKESKNRQVLIFTHDLIFLSSIIGYCEELNINFDCHWIEKLNGQPGIIHLRNTPSYEKSYKKSGKANEFYNKALTCPPEEREATIKNGFAALRTSYEALVIFDLFGGVVQRFNERVSVDSLSGVFFNEEIRDEIIDCFYQCCRYMEGHLHSDKYAYKKPDCKNLKEEINRFNEVKKKLKQLKNN